MSDEEDEVLGGEVARTTARRKCTSLENLDRIQPRTLRFLRKLTHKLDKLTADDVLYKVDRLRVGVLDLAEHKHHLRDLLGVLVFPMPRRLWGICRLLRRRGHVGRCVVRNSPKSWNVLRIELPASDPLNALG